jgi:hypothetical protein
LSYSPQVFVSELSCLVGGQHRWSWRSNFNHIVEGATIIRFSPPPLPFKNCITFSFYDCGFSQHLREYPREAYISANTKRSSPIGLDEIIEAFSNKRCGAPSSRSPFRGTRARGAFKTKIGELLPQFCTHIAHFGEIWILLRLALQS